MKALGLASVASLLIQPLVFALWFVLPDMLHGKTFSVHDILPMSVAVIVVAAFHLVVFGLPLFYILWYTNHATWPWIVVAGFVSGSVLLILYAFPSWLSPEVWYDWHSDIPGIVISGSHGVAGALAFLFVWRRYRRPNNSFKPKPLRGSA